MIILIQRSSDLGYLAEKSANTELTKHNEPMLANQA